MLSNRFYLILSYIIPVYNLLGVNNLEWNTERKIFVKRNKRNRLLLLNTALLVVWMLYGIFQIARFYKARNIGGFILVFFFCCAWSLMVVAWLLTNWFEDDFFIIANSTIVLLRRFNEVYLPKHDPNTSRFVLLFDFFGLGFLLAIGGISLSIVVVNLILPDLPFMVGSNLPEATPLVVQILVSLCHGAAGMVQSLNCSIPIYFGIMVGPLLIKFVFAELRLGRKYYMGSDSLRELPDILTVYRSCQIIILVYVNRLIGRFLFPAQALTTVLFCISVWILVKVREELDLLTGVIIAAFSSFVPIVWGMVLVMAGYIFSSGNGILNSWKTNEKWKTKEERKIMAKYRKACIPFRLSWEKTFVIRKATVLNYMKGLSRGIVRTMLTLKL